MIFTEQERDVALKLFSTVAAATADPAGGVTRESYGAGESIAWSCVAGVARDLGLFVEGDAADNLAMMASDTPPDGARGNIVMIGSHLDSVPCGGNYDGLAGVIAALLCVWKEKQRGSKYPLMGMGFRGEESAWYGRPHVGVRAMFGRLTDGDLALEHRDGNGRTLKHALAMRGKQDTFDARALREFWELHVEQGPVLDTGKIPVGIVTDIRGHARTTNGIVRGRAGHSGTTPHYMRRDAVMHFIDFARSLEERRQDMTGEGHDIVFTFGIVGTNPTRHSVTSIADEVHFSLDVRSASQLSLAHFMAGLRTGVNYVELGDLRVSSPCALSPGLADRAVKAADALGVSRLLMPSGAGHDASVFVAEDVPAGMVFVRNQGGSHNPHERMDIDDFMLGVEVLWASIQQ